MDTPSTDPAMDRPPPPDANRPSLAYALAAAAIWALVLYSLSPLSRPPAVRVALAGAAACGP